MTRKEFYRRFALIAGDFKGYSGLLRCKDGRCPILGVYHNMKGTPYLEEKLHNFDFFIAASRIGLSPANARKIVDASDLVQAYNLTIRKALVTSIKRAKTNR